MAYNQPPYQTTVMQPVVVQPVQPVVVPVVSGHNTRPFRGPAFLRKGAKLGSCHVPGQCICFMSIFGGVLFFQYIILLFAMGSLGSYGFSFPGLISVPIVCITCYLCISAKKNHDKERSQDNTAPSSEPFTDVGYAQSFGYSGQGQQTAPPMYAPVPTGVPPQTQYPYQTAQPMYVPITSGVPPTTQYPYQPGSFPPPGMATAPGVMQYPQDQFNHKPEKNSPPEYGQQPSFAPPEYSP